MTITKSQRFIPNGTKKLFTLTSLILMTSSMATKADEPKDEEGVPHIVLFDDAGQIGIEFNVVEPTIIEGIPTVTVFTSQFNELASEYTSAPLSGIDSGFLNDDSGFESELPLTGSNIVVTLTDIDPNSDGSPESFFVALGANFLTAQGQSFTLGSSFDTHPTYGLFSSDPLYTGSVTLIFELSDTNNILQGTQTIGVKISADPTDAILPGGPCSPADFTLDGALDFFDVSVFLQLYNNGDLTADLANDGVLDFFDVSVFLSEFALGCP